MNTQKKSLRRSGAKIMASLIALLGSLSYIMILAVINGSVGFVCAMGVTVFGAVASTILTVHKLVYKHGSASPEDRGHLQAPASSREKCFFAVHLNWLTQNRHLK